MSFRRLPEAAATTSTVVGIAVLFGWILDVGTLKRIAPGLPSMKANTAIGFIVGGVALWLVRDPEPTLRRRRIATGLACALTVLALLTLAEYVFHVDLGIDHLFHDSEVGRGYPGRTSPHSALAFAAIGAWLATIATPEIRQPAAGRVMSVVACVVVLLVGIGYLYDVDYLRGSSSANGVALHTLITFTLLCAGIIASRPHASFLTRITSSGPGGEVVRRLVPGFVGLGLLLLGILRAAGERTLNIYGTRAGTGLIIGSIVILGVASVLRIAPLLDRIDADRRRLQQDLLRRSESRLDAIVETTNDVIATISREGLWTYVNPAVRAVYGYEPEEMVGRRFTDFTDPERFEPAVATFARILAGESVSGHETVHRRKDGSPVVMSFNAVPDRDDHGNVVGVIATGDDITERWLAAADARIAHERLEAVLDRTPALVFMKGSDGRYTFANRAVGEFFGRPREQIVGRDDSELFPPETARELRRTDSSVIDRGEAVRLEERMPHPNGDRVYLSVRFPLRDAEGRVVEVCGVSTDITELQQRQDDLARRRDEQAAISALGTIALQGTPVAELARRAAQVAVDLLEVDACRVVRLQADGTERPLGGAARPGFAEGPDGSGATLSLVSHERNLGSVTVAGGTAGALGPDAAAALQSIANVLAAAIDRDDAQQILEDRLSEIAQLAAARGRLVTEALAAEDRERARLSDALHDDALQNLLAVRQDLAEAERSPERALAIVAHARAIVEATAGGIRELVSSVHPVTLGHAGLETALTSIAQFHAARGGFAVAVTVDETANGTNGPLLVRLARELLSNAEKHAKAGRVDMNVRREDGTVILQVEDDGCGMPAGRAESALREGHIGLASAEERVRALGGTFDLWSEPNAGTRIRVTLPATEHG